MKRPRLKQFGVLTEADLQEHPVWIACHLADYDESWYEETDEETFRPWTGVTPVDPGDGLFLVQATFVFRDGSRHTGFVTPSQTPDDLGTMQPEVFVGTQRFGFWGGVLGISVEQRATFYHLASKLADNVFPLRFEAESGLAQHHHSGVVEGFYRGPSLRTVEIER